tara:strand:- start:74 stop:427 length:354 start_codon:yes stop_codon:yes gene_type:complete
MKLKDLLSENSLGALPSSKLMKMKWNPVTQSNLVNETSSTSGLDELHEAAFSLNESFATWKMQFAPMTLSGVTLDPKKIFTVKARSTVEAIKKASKQAGLSGSDWMATQTHKLIKIG